MARMDLPDNDKALVTVLDAELSASEGEMNLNRIGWRIIDGYLKGARKFNVHDPYSGRVTVENEHLRGEVLFRYEKIVRQYMVEVGRWLQSDLSPVVRRKGESLGAMRSAAIANAVLQARLASINKSQLRTRLVIPYLKYGIVGVAHYETGNPKHPSDIAIVPPYQLRGFPAYCEGLESLQGVGRKRWVPLRWLRDKVLTAYNVDLDKYNPESDLEAQRVAWGTTPPGYSVVHDAAHGPHGVTSPRDLNPRGRVKMPPLGVSIGSKDNEEWDEDLKEDGRWYVPMDEIHVYADDQTYSAAYVLKVGRTIVYQEDYEESGRRIICPLQVARFTDTGTMFSRGFVAPLIPGNDQFEKVVSSVCRNIRDSNMFGTLMVSGGMNVDLKTWNKPGPYPRADKYNIDPLSQNAQPFTLQPSNPGLLPVRLGAFLQEISDDIAGQGPFFSGQAAGRTDSAAGHGALFNMGNIGLGLPAHNLSDALANIYGRELQAARDSMGSGETIRLTVIDENLAGVVFDPASGEASLSENPIPEVQDVSIDVKDRTPRDPDVRKKELAEHHAAGLLGRSPTESFYQYWITAFEENLDIIGAPKDVIETHRKAVWQIILLFNDGKTPGPVQFTEYTQNPEVQKMVLRRFMNKIEFSLASDEVQQEFELWDEALDRLMGREYPTGLPPPEDVAATEQARQQQMQQAQAPGGFEGMIGT